MARSFVVQRNICACLLLGLLAACASSQPPINQAQEAEHYQAAARNNYTPPGTQADPWGPYISEASARFDVPQRWIREVIAMESGGHQYIHGALTTSATGAMGLMQVEPETYDELRAEYQLGSDPYDPHDNILAGTAYLRQMYNQFGSPGFLAAYDAGPRRLANYLAGKTDLPNETRQYVASIGSELGSESPVNPSRNDGLAYNSLPLYVPAGRRRYGGSMTEVASNQAYDPPEGRAAVARVSASNLAAPVPPTPPSMAVAFNAPRHHGGLSLVSSAYADELPQAVIRGGTANWGIQVGAYSNRELARAASVSAKQQSARLMHAVIVVGSVERGAHIMYRARLAGLTREQAENACDRLGHGACLVVSPASAS